MAIGPLTNALCLIGATDLSDHCRAVSVEDSRNPIDITAMGATSITITKGLGDAKITFELYQDFAAGKTHATLQPLIGSTTPVTIETRNDKTAGRSATNPGIVMQGLLMVYQGLDGSVGDASVIKAEFVNGAQAGITYPTS